MMTKISGITFIVGISVGLTFADVPPQQQRERQMAAKWGQIEAWLKSDSDVKREAAAKALATQSPEKHDPKQVVNLISAALKSTDQEVQVHGAHAAYRISYAHQPREHRKRGKQTDYDLSRAKEIKPQLVKLLGHPDPEARSSAILTLALTYDPDIKLKPSIVEQYKKSDNIAVKGSLLELMTSWGYRSRDLTELFIKALESDQPYIQEQAAKGLGQLRAADAIVPLVRAYVSTPSAVQEDILRALDQYKNADPQTQAQFSEVAEKIKKLHEQLQETAKAATGKKLPPGAGH